MNLLIVLCTSANPLDSMEGPGWAITTTTLLSADTPAAQQLDVTVSQGFKRTPPYSARLVCTCIAPSEGFNPEPESTVATSTI